MATRITPRPAVDPPRPAAEGAKRAAAPSTAPAGHGLEDLFGALTHRLEEGARKLLGVVEHAVWQVEEDVRSRLSGRPNAEQIFTERGLWAEKVSGGRTAGVDLTRTEAELGGLLAPLPAALARNPELGRAKSYAVVNGSLALAPASRKAVEGLQAPFDAMFASTVDALGALRKGTLTPSGYMVRVMANASKIASDWATAKQLPDATRNEAFARLVHFAFCAHRDDDVGRGLESTDLKREVVGFGISDAGSLLEDTYRMQIAHDFSKEGKDPSHPEVFGNGVKGGFNYRIQDRVSGASTVTHHFGEFLGTGYVNLLAQADADVLRVDSPAKNPADVRNGDFAVMLGGGLATGRIDPEQAVALTRWAFTKPSPGEAPPPWGNPPVGEDDGRFLAPEAFRLDDWLDAFRSAHPAADA